ncbi:hypothetical protein A2397_00665 [Candidatus Amesbacteria bacterium RIFOXYB1_FULL_44_23]|uniref:Uncharacterized protein n=1 Tax=Candidatus Amesbacteria bacterium RIFOXYB1_FULL_44_23 TaxID=1797263 RepID=A0A1F4ZPP9_9BACT|nr:MAG: hypothetical protein A2397_00665 [Candidatus Amesbacteria bacterium RIFOXYB1_FULL_44_23]
MSEAEIRAPYIDPMQPKLGRKVFGVERDGQPDLQTGEFTIRDGEVATIIYEEMQLAIACSENSVTINKGIPIELDTAGSRTWRGGRWVNGLYIRLRK